MPVNEIGNTPQVLPASIQAQDRSSSRLVQDPAGSFTSALAAGTATQDLTPAQRAALLINQTLRNLSFAQQSPLDATELNPQNLLLNALSATQNLTPAQRAALRINENLQNLSLAPANPEEALLLNATNPSIETIGPALETRAVQRATDLANTTQENLSIPTPASPQAASAAGISPTTNPLLPGVTAPQTSLVTPLVTTASAETLLRPQDQNVLTSAGPQPRNPNPFAFAVYEVKDPKPAPEDPKPIKREVHPPQPMGRVRPVDRLTLKREWKRRREGGTREPIPAGVPDVEKAIRQVINQANDDMAANGLPLHLVLAKDERGYTLDIYDCSSEDMCLLEQEIPLDLKELTTLLDNIQHETGIIINVNT